MFSSRVRFNHIYASFAKQERREISKRTKAALAAARTRGTLMGTRRTNCAGGVALTEKMRREGQERAESLRPRIEALPPDASFCEQCGARLEALGLSCGASVSAGGRFCKKCGGRLDSGGRLAGAR